MKKSTHILALFLLLFALGACKKTEEVIIPDNQVPYYEGVTTIQVQNYVTRAFIDISGREPNVTERDNWVNILKANQLDSLTRNNFISSLQSGSDFVTQFNNVYIAPMFDGIFDSLAIVDELNDLDYKRSLAVANGDSALSQFWSYEVIKLDLVKRASAQYHSNQISLNEFKRRMAHNWIYDQINMGTTNFVISCFENYLKRLPTDMEQSNSETMVDGQSARIFMRDGSSRGDFLNIMTTTTGFYEGLVIDTYLHLLSRRPNSIEMGWNTADLENGTRNIKDLQRKLAVSKEYAGF